MELSQQAFADHLGVPRLWVTTVENGRGNPTFTRLLEVLGRAGLTLVVDDGKPSPVRPPRAAVDLDELLSNWSRVYR